MFEAFLCNVLNMENMPSPDRIKKLPDIDLVKYEISDWEVGLILDIYLTVNIKSRWHYSR